MGLDVCQTLSKTGRHQEKAQCRILVFIYIFFLQQSSNFVDSLGFSFGVLEVELIAENNIS